MNLNERITVDPAVLVGKPTVRGTRLSVEQVLEHLAAGWTLEELLENYPRLEAADVQACLAYARSVVSEQRVYPLSA